MADDVFRPPFGAVGVRLGGDPSVAAKYVPGLSLAAYRIGLVSGASGVPFKSTNVLPNGGVMVTSNFGGSTRSYIEALDKRKEIIEERRRAKIGVIGMLVVDRRVTTAVWDEDLTMMLPNDERVISAVNADKKTFPLGFYGYTFLKDASKSWNRANTISTDITTQTIYKFSKDGVGRVALPGIHNVVYQADMQVTFNAYWGGAAGKVIGTISYMTRDTAPQYQHLGSATGVALGVDFDKDGVMSVRYSDTPINTAVGWVIMPEKTIQIGVDLESGVALKVTRVSGEGFVFHQTLPNGEGDRTWTWKTWAKDPLGGPAKEKFDLDTGASVRARSGMWFIPPKKLNPRLRWH